MEPSNRIVSWLQAPRHRGKLRPKSFCYPHLEWGCHKTGGFQSTLSPLSLDHRTDRSLNQQKRPIQNKSSGLCLHFLIYTRMQTPQCHLLQNLALSSSKRDSGNTDGAAVAISSDTRPAEVDLLGLPDDVLFQILQLCDPREVDETVKLVCSRLQ